MTTEIDWNDPAARFALIERVGHEEYNRLNNQYIDSNPIRPVSTRFGTLFAVGRTGVAFATREEAEAYLAKATGSAA